MRFILTKIIIILFIFFFKNVYADNFQAEYYVSTSGIKIGKVSWSLIIEGDKYYSELNLKNSGFFSPLYRFLGTYKSTGIIQNKKFSAKKYEQYWKTKKKTKTVNMIFDNYLVDLVQEPKESEVSRVNLNGLFQYYDPITSFINILYGEDEAKTVDGRRIYIMQKIKLENSNDINIKIKNYKNIWADHKRNDLKKIEFYLMEEKFFPQKIYIYFKDRVFRLDKY